MNAYCTFPKGRTPQSNLGSRFWESGWQGGGSYVRRTQMAGNLQCFLLPELFMNEMPLRRPLQKICMFCSVFRIKKGRLRRYSLYISGMLDFFFFFFDGAAFVELV